MAKWKGSRDRERAEAAEDHLKAVSDRLLLVERLLKEYKDASVALKKNVVALKQEEDQLQQGVEDFRHDSAELFGGTTAGLATPKFNTLLEALVQQHKTLTEVRECNADRQKELKAQHEALEAQEETIDALVLPKKIARDPALGPQPHWGDWGNDSE